MKKRYTTIFALALALLLSVTAFTACSIFEDNSKKDIINAYDIAVANGFVGTEEEWLESLKGKDGDNAQTVYTSLYEEAVERGFNGSFEDFLREYFGSYVQSGTQASVAAAADRAVLSTVSVYSSFVKTTVSYDRRGNKLYKDETYGGAGAGVIVELNTATGDAYVITNFHVVYDSNDNDGYANTVELYVYGRTLDVHAVPATIIGATATYDIAVLKVTGSEIFKSSNLRAAEFASSNYIGAGDTIFAVGNPEAAGISVTSGIVSVDSEYITMTSPKDEKTLMEYRVIRIDAAVNGGNSGGGLFDINGKLVGIVNAKVVSSEIDNIAYAIPSAIVQNVYKNILKNCDGETSRQAKKCLVGITVEIKDSYAMYDPLLCDTRIIHTVAVKDVGKESVAFGKLIEGDVLVSFDYNGETFKIERLYSITDHTLLFESGKTVTFTVKRDGKTITVPVTLGSENVID